MKTARTANVRTLPLPSRREVFGQLRATAPILVGATLLTAVAFIVVAQLHFDERVSAYQLIDDPAPFVGLESYTGLLSYAGVLLWCAAATVSGFGGALLWSVRSARQLSRFLVILAGVNAWLALDDLFVLHEDWAVKLFGWESRHVGEAMFFAAYAVIMVACFVRFRATIARSDYVLLVAAVVSLGISTALDVVLQLEMGGNNIFLEAVLSRSWGGPVVDIAEELLKLNGVFLWFAYLTRVAFGGVHDAMRQTPEGAFERQANRPAMTKRRRTKRH